MWPRILMLLLVLIAPASSLAAAVCCDQGASTDACGGPAGLCPISDEGECVLLAEGEAFRTSLPGAEHLLDLPGPAVSMAPATVAFDFPQARDPAATSRYLRFQSLRI